jgi:hypothetical protein
MMRTPRAENDAQTSEPPQDRRLSRIAEASLLGVGEGDMSRMDRDEQRRRLRARGAFLEDLSASLALRERVFPTRARKVRARQRHMLAYLSR